MGPTETYYAVSLGLQIFGSLLGMSAANKQSKAMAKMAEEQYKQDTLVHNFNWQEAQDMHTFQLEDIEAAEWNMAQSRKYQEEAAIQEWIDRDKLRLFDYNNQVSAYNASLEAYGKQLQVNDIAAAIAAETADRGYNDQLTLLGFQHEDLLLGEAKAERDVDLKQRTLKSKRAGTISETALKRRSLEQQFADKQREFSIKLEDNSIKGQEKLGQVLAYGRSGRSARKNLASVKAANDRLGFALYETLNSSHSNYELDVQKLNDTLETYGRTVDFNDEELVNTLYTQRVESDFAKQQYNEQLRSINLQREVDIQKQKLDKHSAHIRAQGMVTSKPVLPPQLSKPLEMPEPKLVKPRAPREGPRPRKYASGGGHGLAALAGGLQSISSAVGTFGAAKAQGLF